MLDKLYDYFDNAVGDVNKDGNTLNVGLYGNFGDVELFLDFDKNEFTVMGKVDESQYCSIFMIDEDEIDYDDLEAWNTTDVYSDINQALDRAQEIVDAYLSESDGSDIFEDIDDCETIFTDAKNVIKS